jgi:predicted acylesterase/phospholipase RssA
MNEQNSENQNIHDPYNTLILSGGSVNGIIILGALQYMYDKEQLHHIKNYYGTSVGSVIAYLLILGYNPTQILLNIISQKLVDNFKKINIINLTNGNGGFDWTSIDEFLLEMTLSKCEQPLTFEDIWKMYGVNFVCCTYNISQREVEYFSYKTHPKLLCTSAIRMSCNLPLFFPRYRYNNDYYVDGGIIDNFPISLAQEGDIVFGLYLSRSGNKNVQKLDKSESDTIDDRLDNNIEPDAHKCSESAAHKCSESTDVHKSSESADAHKCSELPEQESSDAHKSPESSEQELSDAHKSFDSSEQEECVYQEGNNDTDTSNFCLQSYITDIFMAPLTYHTVKKIDDYLENIKDDYVRENTKIIKLHVTKMPIDFNLSTYDQLEMFSQGYQYLKQLE